MLYYIYIVLQDCSNRIQQTQKHCSVASNNNNEKKKKLLKDYNLKGNEYDSLHHYNYMKAGLILYSCLFRFSRD